jgi:dUTP pyrophosphatase
MKKLRISCKDEQCMPTRAHPTDAGLDLRAAEEVILSPKITKKVPTGIHVEIPEGYVGLIFPRSGLASKEGVILSNIVGVIDSDYRGEIICALQLTKLHQIKKTIKQYDRIAQLVIVPIALPRLSYKR